MPHLPRPDPTHESPRAAGARFRESLRWTLGFIALLWIILLVDGMLDLGLGRWGVRPHEMRGLVGLVTMPLLHGGPLHLAHNTLPALLLGGGLLYFYPTSRWRVLPWFWVMPGLFVWIVGHTGSTHYGASGLNFALLGFLALGGLLRREAGTLGLSMGVVFYYGGMLTGVLPIERGVSWEGHLGGLLTGLALAIIYRRWDIPPPRRYDYELEEEEEESAPLPEDWAELPDDDRPRTLH